MCSMVCQRSRVETLVPPNFMTIDLIGMLPVFAILIVGPPFVRVGQHLVGFVDPYELLFTTTLP